MGSSSTTRLTHDDVRPIARLLPFERAQIVRCTLRSKQAFEIHEVRARRICCINGWAGRKQMKVIVYNVNKLGIHTKLIAKSTQRN